MNVLSGLGCGAMIADPITGDVIHMVGSMFNVCGRHRSLLLGRVTENGRGTVRENPRGNKCLGKSPDRNRIMPEAGYVFLVPARLRLCRQSVGAGQN